MLNPKNSYNKVSSQHQQSGQGSPIYQFYLQHDSSPFSKHLAMIPETQTPQQMRFAFQNIDGVIQSQQYLGQSFQSRLYEQKQMKSSLMSQSDDRSVFSPGQRNILINRIYEKEKELVLLEDKMYMIKNTNQCLRDTIKQINGQKDRLLQQIDQLRQLNTNQKQIITELQQQLSTLQQKLLSTKQTEQQQYFKQNNIMSKSRQQLIGQNQSLQQSIRQMTNMYERQIAMIIQKNYQEKEEIQKQWSGLVEEKDNLLRQGQRGQIQKQQQMEQKQLMMEIQRKQTRQKMQSLQKQLNKVTTQKKQLLKQYMQAIQTMRHHISNSSNANSNSYNNKQFKQISSQTIIPETCSNNATTQNILIVQQQDSYEQHLQQQHYKLPTVQSQRQMIKSLQKQNDLLQNIIITNNNNSNNCKQNQNRINELYSSRKENCNHVNNNNISYDTRLLSNTNSIASLKPIKDLNTSYNTHDRLNQTMINHYNPQRSNPINSYNSYHINSSFNNNKRSTSNSNSNYQQRQRTNSRMADQYRSTKSKINNHSIISYINPYNITPTKEYINTNKIYSKQNHCHFNNKNNNNNYRFNQKLYKDIDNKLEQIKYQINKEITY